jgi:hypothetical protein
MYRWLERWKSSPPAEGFADRWSERRAFRERRRGFGAGRWRAFRARRDTFSGLRDTIEGRAAPAGLRITAC